MKTKEQIEVSDIEFYHNFVTSLLDAGFSDDQVDTLWYWMEAIALRIKNHTMNPSPSRQRTAKEIVTEQLHRPTAWLQSPKQRTVTGFAVLLTDKNRLECSFQFKNEAKEYASQFYGAKIVPCTISYTLPKPKRNRNKKTI